MSIDPHQSPELTGRLLSEIPVVLALAVREHGKIEIATTCRRRCRHRHRRRGRRVKYTTTYRHCADKRSHGWSYWWSTTRLVSGVVSVILECIHGQHAVRVIHVLYTARTAESVALCARGRSTHFTGRCRCAVVRFRYLRSHASTAPRQWRVNGKYTRATTTYIYACTTYSSCRRCDVSPYSAGLRECRRD